MLTRAFLKNLATKAQQLNPVVMIGTKGLTETVHQEIDGALLAHELIKIRVSASTKEDRQTMIDQIIAQHEAALVQKIGHVVVIYRKKPD